MNVSQGTIIRTACLVLALLNTALALFGKSPLPFDDAMIENIVTFCFDVAAAGVAWWKNNSFTKPAIKADEMLEKFRALQAADE